MVNSLDGIIEEKRYDREDITDALLKGPNDIQKKFLKNLPETGRLYTIRAISASYRASLTSPWHHFAALFPTIRNSLPHISNWLRRTS